MPADYSEFKNKSKDVDTSTPADTTQFREFDDLTAEEQEYYSDDSIWSAENTIPLEVANPLLVTNEQETYYAYNPNKKINTAFDTSLPMKSMPKAKKVRKRGK